MAKNIRSFLNKLKDWSTTKTSLYIAIYAIIIYTLADCVFGVVNAKYGSVFYFDSTLTSEWFEFWKWVVISGGTITVTKVLKTPKDNEGEIKRMNIQLLITGLAFVSALTTATTEAIKKLIDKETKNSTLIAAIVAIVLSAAVGVFYIVFNHQTFSLENCLTMVAFAFLAFLCATVGYDKIKEILEKFGVK